jgi:anti-anti-sigma factor
MDITVSHEQGRVPVTVFHITGDIDHGTSGQLQSQAIQAIEAGTRNLLLDLANAPYVSSAGIRAFMIIFNRLRTDSPEENDAAINQGLRDGTYKSPHLKLINPGRLVAEALKMAGVDMLLETHTHLKDAIASF